ncbi:unnamed protein product [Spirodela intermedia]|uniref:Transcription repressor n=1 Tax=Spirodela intermedia TaxID=51605 RepID=A0A7I8IUB9_SPIIN|nr:unnamed protein product [Spirodela intermedia]CAA6661140.1 unnamed protein product [Spirodela intermedia]
MKTIIGEEEEEEARERARRLKRERRLRHHRGRSSCSAGWSCSERGHTPGPIRRRAPTGSAGRPAPSPPSPSWRRRRSDTTPAARPRRTPSPAGFPSPSAPPIGEPPPPPGRWPPPPLAASSAEPRLLPPPLRRRPPPAPPPGRSWLHSGSSSRSSRTQPEPERRAEMKWVRRRKQKQKQKQKQEEEDSSCPAVSLSFGCFRCRGSPSSSRRSPARTISGRRGGGAWGFAVVKRSRDPQRDFRESMVEMIERNGMGRAEELEGLLACYLALNADEYHDVIVRVFRQLWLEMDPSPPPSR